MASACALTTFTPDLGHMLPRDPVLTGPNIVDSSNIGPTLEGVKKGAR